MNATKKESNTGRPLEEFTFRETLDLIYHIYAFISATNKRRVEETGTPWHLLSSRRFFHTREQSKKLTSPGGLDEVNNDTRKAIHQMRGEIYRLACSGSLNYFNWHCGPETDLNVVQKHIPWVSKTIFGDKVYAFDLNEQSKNYFNPEPRPKVVVDLTKMKEMNIWQLRELLYATYGHFSDFHEEGRKDRIFHPDLCFGPEVMAIVKAVKKAIYLDVCSGTYEGSTYSLGMSKYAIKAAQHFPNWSVKVTGAMDPYYVFKAPRAKLMFT